MKKALVIGINKYPSAPLSGCVNDAEAFASIIEKNGDGTPNFSVKLKTDVQTKAELKGLIIDVFKGDNDTALFYFSGHGFINDIGGYIVTPDYRHNDEGVSMDEILTIANDSEAKNRVIILDCCYSGALGSPKITGGKIAHIAKGVSVLTASKDSETSVEINGHGIFTNLLLDALQGGAADLNGRITPGSIYAYIDQALGVWYQRPVFKTNTTEFITLRTVIPHVPIEVLRKLTEYFSTPTEQYRLDPSYEDTNSLQTEHKVIEPHAKSENVAIFKDLQKLQSIGLIVPVDAPFMYFAAMDSKTCELTRLGHHYWRLAKEHRI
ncbi:MAG: caspase family protein [Bacteroidales bacterium]|nr:caspase family protein [Bacteroidales bacterium]